MDSDLEPEVTFPGDPIPEVPGMGLFDTQTQILRAEDPLGIPPPRGLTSPTDARTFAGLGIQMQGFHPMNTLPEIDMA